MIRNIQLNHGGKYVCIIDTDVESLSAAAILIVKGKRQLQLPPTPLEMIHYAILTQQGCSTCTLKKLCHFQFNPVLFRKRCTVSVTIRKSRRIKKTSPFFAWIHPSTSVDDGKSELLFLVASSALNYIMQVFTVLTGCVKARHSGKSSSRHNEQISID